MSIEKITEATIKTSPRKSLPWLESDTWDESSMWKTDFQAESLWESDSIEENTQSPTLKPPSSEDELVESLENHSFEGVQSAEIVEGEILLTDSVNENSLDEPYTKKESFETNEQIPLQELHEEVEIESNTTAFAHLPLDSDSDSDLEKPLYVESLPVVENLNYEDEENSSEKSYPEEIELLTKQIVTLDTNAADLGTSEVKAVEIQPLEEKSIPLDISNNNSDSDLSSINGNKNDGGVITLDVPIHLVPIVKELINVFEQHPSTYPKTHNSTFKNTFKHQRSGPKKAFVNNS